MSTAQLQAGEMMRIEGAPGAAIRVLRGKVWVTRHQDIKDHILAPGATVALGDPGPALVTALAPTLLERYRADPAAVRREIEAQAQRDRTALIWRCLGRLFA